jgi:hypothetical protein
VVARSDQAILAPLVTARAVPVKQFAVLRKKLEKTMRQADAKQRAFTP